MRKLRIASMICAVLVALFCIIFFIGTSLFKFIPWLNEILLLTDELDKYEIYYGLSLFTVFTNAKDLISANRHWLAIPIGFVVVATFFTSIHVVFASIRRRPLLLIHVIPLVFVNAVFTILTILFFGIPLSADVPYPYFMSVMLNTNFTIPFVKVLFLILFLNYLFLGALLVLFFIESCFIPIRTKKQKEREKNKEFASIKEVRKYSKEEIAKFIQANANEIRVILGLDPNADIDKQVKENSGKNRVAGALIFDDKNPELTKIEPKRKGIKSVTVEKSETPVEEPKPEEKPAIEVKPVEEVKPEEPKVEEKAPEVKPEEPKVEDKPVEQPTISNEELSREIAKAVMENINLDENSTATVIVEAGGTTQELKSEDLKEEKPLIDETKNGEKKPSKKVSTKKEVK